MCGEELFTQNSHILHFSHPRVLNPPIFVLSRSRIRVILILTHFKKYFPDHKIPHHFADRSTCPVGTQQQPTMSQTAHVVSAYPST